MPQTLPAGPLVIGLPGPQLAPADRALLLEPAIGGVILFERNFEDARQLTALCADIHALREPRLLIAVDQEGGRVQRLRPGFTPLPPAAAYGRTYDRDPGAGVMLARAGGLVMASELLALGIDLSFAPVLDLDYGVSEIIGARAFHADANTAAALAGAFMAGMADAGMAACGKHFPGHGAVAADTHLTQVIDERSREAIETDLLPYRQLIGQGLASVMMAHVLFPAVDAQPAGFSRRWVQDILRGELGFDGAVFSDDLGMAGAAGAGDVVARARRALDAGCDYLLICNDPAAVQASVSALPARAVAAYRHRALLARGGSVEAAQLAKARQLLADLEPA
ncbi:beta-N-acetylhexosaminidase [Immundisolibacter sp.]|uniref:beta-N-acetylhexosaminidase n=1 Tax=Immundisolibacter sp. TaxID=1934948 RepID=UPI00261DA330|nr:beta-N-acetylhexosaminidase [Immundisolibacter sp.]MDD3649870.1 beta-N-acetylhexosaminidase [Immundisolibacter sp.]